VRGRSGPRAPAWEPGRCIFDQSSVSKLSALATDHDRSLSSDASLRKTIAEFVTHYYLEPNHQGLGNHLIVPIGRQVKPQKLFQRRQRLGGMLNYYYREAA
jgi:hypothetical protein